MDRLREAGQASDFYPRTTLGCQQDQPGATAVALTDGGRAYSSAQFGLFFWAEDNLLGVHLRSPER